MREWWHRAIDRQARWVAKWLHSRSAFVVLVYGTVLWIPFVVYGIDAHGFLYLYVATSLSLVTQVPLAMLAYWAHRDAAAAEVKTGQTLEAMLATMKATNALMNAMRESFAETEELIEEIHEEIHDDAA